MPETADQNRALCDVCWGSGELNDAACTACSGKGWIVGSPSQIGTSDSTFNTAAESGFNVLDDAQSSNGSGGTSVTRDTSRAASGSKSGDSIFGDDPIGSSSGSQSVMGDDSNLSSKSGPSAGGAAKPNKKVELAKLRKQLTTIQQRIQTLEGSASSSGEDGDQNGNGITPPSSIEDMLQRLEKSKLLDPKQLKVARALGNNTKEFAKKLIAQKLLTHWQASQLIAGRRSFILGKYKLIDMLGHGDIGAIFRGEHIHMSRYVAVRVISQKVSRNKKLLDRFLTQARILAEVDHPNIIQAYNVDHEGKHYFLAMEFVDGDSLEQLVEKNGPLDYQAAADYALQAAEGLEHGHANDFIHGDIKPANFLIGPENVLKMLDLGLSGLQQQSSLSSDTSESSRLIKSIDYISPEHALGATDVDHRADIYSLGCTLYFLLAGQAPFAEGLLYEKLAKHQSETPESIKAKRPDAPDALVAICEKMMEKKPDDRYQTAGEVADALDAFLSS